MAEEEMSLDEYVGVLRRGHRAHAELAQLKENQSAKISRGVVDRLCDVIISFARDKSSLKERKSAKPD